MSYDKILIFWTIKTMVVMMNLHKSKSNIFEQNIKLILSLDIFHDKEASWESLEFFGEVICVADILDVNEPNLILLFFIFF